MVIDVVIFLLVIILVVYIFKKSKKRRNENESDEYKNLDETPFMENLNPEEKVNNFQEEYEKNKTINNLNNFHAP